MVIGVGCGYRQRFQIMLKKCLQFVEFPKGTRFEGTRVQVFRFHEGNVEQLQFVSCLRVIYTFRYN